jgi:hypothetical protein
MSTRTGTYSDSKGNASCFERDEDALDKAAEGSGARPKLKGWDSTKGGYGKASNSAVDQGLKYSGGNEGYTGSDDGNDNK